MGDAVVLAVTNPGRLDVLAKDVGHTKLHESLVKREALDAHVGSDAEL